jgi:hypothetical protein
MLYSVREKGAFASLSEHFATVHVAQLYSVREKGAFASLSEHFATVPQPACKDVLNSNEFLRVSQQFTKRENISEILLSPMLSFHLPLLLFLCQIVATAILLIFL